LGRLRCKAPFRKRTGQMKITEEHIMQFGLFYFSVKSTWRTKAPAIKTRE